MEKLINLFIDIFCLVFPMFIIVNNFFYLNWYSCLFIINIFWTTWLIEFFLYRKFNINIMNNLGYLGKVLCSDLGYLSDLFSPLSQTQRIDNQGKGNVILTTNSKGNPSYPHPFSYINFLRQLYPNKILNFAAILFNDILKEGYYKFSQNSYI